jgi:hypothetical protein
MEEWKPINFRGGWNHDPRGELLARARAAQKQNDTWVAIPVKLAIACGQLRECGDTTTLKVDYAHEPITLHCTKPKDHSDNMHFNGSISWAKK